MHIDIDKICPDTHKTSGILIQQWIDILGGGSQCIGNVLWHRIVRKPLAQIQWLILHGKCNILIPMQQQTKQQSATLSITR